MVVVLLSIGVLALVMLAMAVGPLFSRRCLRGSCGALGAQGVDGDESGCEGCPLRPPSTSRSAVRP